MRNRALNNALRAFAEEAALQLEYDRTNGAEVPFEVLESPGARSALYSYRPLTGAFIRERMGALGRLPSCGVAARTLETLDGVDDYLRARGEDQVPADPRSRADAALRSFLTAIFDGTDDFTFAVERFNRAYIELENTVLEGRATATVIAPLIGLELEGRELRLGDGLSLLRGDVLEDAPREAIWGDGTSGRAATLIVLSVETTPGEEAPITLARSAFRRLLTAIRLWNNGSYALGPAAWTRIDSGAWRLVELGGTGRAHGAPLRVEEKDFEALRDFIALIVSRAGRTGETSWALARFEMGCERVAPFEALTDYLLALRALLEPEGPGSGRLAQRLALLCAMPADRQGLAERVAHAISLERAVIAGLAPAQNGVSALVDELASHLRALLRDVTCGHLDADLIHVAEELGDMPAGPLEVDADLGEYVVYENVQDDDMDETDETDEVAIEVGEGFDDDFRISAA